MQNLKDNYLLLRDLPVDFDLDLSSKYHALLHRQIEKLRSNLLEAMSRAIERPSSRTHQNIIKVAIWDSRLLAKRLKDLKNAGESKEGFEESVLDFYQRMMIKTGVSKGEVRKIWIESLLET